MSDEAFHLQLQRESAPTWAAIDALPFLARLADGSLEEERFAWFITQDIHYLDTFANVLLRAATWADDSATRAFLRDRAANVERVEVALHGTLAPRLGISVEVVRATEPAAVTVAYTDHLLKIAAAGPLAEVIAAVLPCYWVYRHVGLQLIDRLPDHDLYANWIRAYAAPEFGAAVDSQLALVDTLAAAATPAVRERMTRWFQRSLRYEWMFWDQADRQAHWPVV